MPDELIEEIARRAAEILRAELAGPEWLTLEQAADHLQTTARALRWRAQQGRLPGGVKDGNGGLSIGASWMRRSHRAAERLSSRNE